MIFHIYARLGDPAAHQLQLDNDDLGTYTLFVHRKSLCEVYERQCNGTNSKPEDSLGGGSMPDVQVEGSGSEDSETKDSESKDSGLEDEDVSMFTTAEDEDEDYEDDDDDDYDDDESVGGSGIEDDVLTDNDPIPIPWTSWGPPITRWFPADDSNATQWITTTAGQRGVMCRSHPELARQYVVLDFNPESLRRAEILALDPSTRVHCYRNHEVMPADGLFKNPVVCKLPFVVCTSEGSYAWDGAMIDEERVLGLEVHVFDVLFFFSSVR